MTAHGPDFDALVREHHGFVRAWLRRLTRGDAHLADDLAQDTFLRALRAADTFRGDAQPRTWLARIAINVWHDHLRRFKARAGEHTQSLETICPEEARELDVPDGASPLADIVASRVDIDRALDRLPTAERTVVLHACWGDLSQAEIAELTGMPLGSVKTLHRRAMKRLHEWLENTA